MIVDRLKTSTKCRSKTKSSMDFQRMATSVQTSKWEKPILGVLLNLIHHICDVLIRIWLYVQLFVKKLLISSSFKNDFAALEKSLQQSEKHIALAFLESSISIKEVAKLVLWSIASGAKNISLYDVGGYLKHHQNELKDQVKTYLKLAGQDPHLSWNKISDKDVTICLLSREDGQEDIVKAARKLAQSVANGDLRVDELNENLLESNLSAKSKGLADPDILFRFGLAHSNQGFPPWQVRLSEIHDINTHHGVMRGDFYQVLLKYSRCQQRFGR